MTNSKSLHVLAEELGVLARSQGLHITTAESCTGGGVAHLITSVPGSSQWFELGLVTYSNRMKSDLLAVPLDLIDKQGAVSEPVVQAMLVGALRLSGAEVGVSISGIAGPGGGSKEKPVGTVCFAWGFTGNMMSSTQYFEGDRASVRHQALIFSINTLIDTLSKG